MGTRLAGVSTYIYTCIRSGYDAEESNGNRNGMKKDIGAAL